MAKLKKRSLKLTLFLFAVGFVIIGSFVNHSLSSLARDKIFTSISTVSERIFKDSLRYNLIRGQYSQVLLNCKDYLDSKFVTSIKITTRDGSIVCNISKRKNGTTKHFEVYFDNNKTESIANVYISYNFSFINNFFMLQSALFFLLFLFAALFAGLWFLRFYKLILDSFSSDIWGDGSSLFNKELFNKRFKNLTTYTELRGIYKTMETFGGSLNEAQKNIVKLSKQEEKYRVARQVVHDLRSPLSLLKVIGSKLDDSALKTNYSIATSRISEICSSLLNHNANETLIPIIPSLYIGELVNELKINLPLTKKRQITTQTKIADSVIFVNIIDFKNLFSNLLTNAIDATQEDGTIVVKESTNFDSYTLSIKDNGCGIPDNDINSIFNEGFTKGKKTGTGLGLFNSKRTLDKWGGKIQVQSIVGIGSEFKITLPLFKNSPLVTRVKDLKDKVIIIDDSTRDIDLIKQYLNIRCNITSYKSLSTLPDNLPKEGIIYLIDNDLGVSSGQLGIDFIIKQSIQGISYLLTNSFDDPLVISKARENKIKIIPKPLIQDLFK